jgi:hypothetical protein
MPKRNNPIPNLLAAYAAEQSVWQKLFKPTALSYWQVQSTVVLLL